MHLTIGNKMYSSWSLRPWLVLRAFDIPFSETVLPLDTDEFYEHIAVLGGNGKVPLLRDGNVTVWESLAIIEYLAERLPDKAIWPRDMAARAHARAISNEMHAGFQALRAACPMNLGKRYRRRDRGSDVAEDVARVEMLWREARSQFADGGAGTFLYGPFTAADAMFAPVVSRLDTYDIAVGPDTRSYMDAVLTSPAFLDWREAALDEDWIVDADEVDDDPVEILRRQ